jgi:hypothetical protein
MLTFRPISLTTNLGSRSGKAPYPHNNLFPSPFRADAIGTNIKLAFTQKTACRLGVHIGYFKTMSTDLPL